MGSHRGLKMSKKTGAEKVLDELRKTLVQANKQARAKKTISHDRMVSMSKLTNAYVKLFNATTPVVKEEVDPFETGDPDFHSRLTSG